MQHIELETPSRFYIINSTCKKLELPQYFDEEDIFDKKTK